MNLKTIVRENCQVLLFQSFKPSQPFKDYVIYGFLITWLCGIGRYWDHPNADWWQYLGLGSVFYVLILALVLMIIIYPLRPENWRYSRILAFVMFTSPPALLYAIPVEQFMALDVAQDMNAWFLFVVAVWRILLLGRFLYTSAKLNPLSLIIGTFLPIVSIVVLLTILNLEHAVFQIMAGNAPPDPTVYDGAYAVVFMISYLSLSALPAMLIMYLLVMIGVSVNVRHEKRSQEEARTKERGDNED